ncbi:MAG: hypothetical protein J2P27_00370 [Actinobacteria bacterium]|nr:hypothetical protein [Actinomycetota bacterium]
MVVVLVILAGLLVWHATRANQARLGIRSRRAQIRGMRTETRKFGLRGIVILIIFILVVIAAVRR